MKNFVFFACALMLTASIFGMAELGTTPSARRLYIDELIRDSFAGYGLQDEQLAQIKEHLLQLPESEYMKIVGSIAPRGQSGRDEEKNAAAIIQALAQIAAHLDNQNQLMEQQVAQMQRANDANDEDGEREQEAHDLAKSDSAFARYQWKVSTALGVLGTLLSTAMAIWQGDVATQCMQNATA